MEARHGGGVVAELGDLLGKSEEGHGRAPCRRCWNWRSSAAAKVAPIPAPADWTRRRWSSTPGGRRAIRGRERGEEEEDESVDSTKTELDVVRERRGAEARTRA